MTGSIRALVAPAADHQTLSAAWSGLALGQDAEDYGSWDVSFFTMRKSCQESETGSVLVLQMPLQ